MTQPIEVGRVLKADTSSFVFGCRVNQLDLPAFGALVRAPVGAGYQVYGLIHDIRIQDDGLVRQLVTAESVSDEVVRDNRERRIVPVELSVIVTGYEVAGIIHHLLPPRPALSLDLIYLCNHSEVNKFTSTGRFGYLRHVVSRPDVPVGELLAAHISQARGAHEDSARWVEAAVKEMIALVRDDYSLLNSVLGALDTVLSEKSDTKLDN